MGRLTIADVAKACKVSPATVSAALHGTGRVGDETRNTIRQVAKSLGYRPRLGAQILRANRTSRIGLILPGKTDGVVMNQDYAWPILQAFTTICHATGITGDIEFFNRSDEAGRLPDRLEGGLFDGCLLAGHISANLRKTLTEQNDYPWVSIDEPGPHSVVAATDEGVWLSVQYLAALGHRRIAFCGGPTRYSMHRLAREGFLRGIQDFSLEARDSWIREDDYLCSEGTDSMLDHVVWSSDIVSIPDRPTAIICVGMGAASAISYALITCGLRIPDQVSLIAIGAKRQAMTRYPAVTCIDLDFFQMASVAIQMLRSLLQDEKVVEKTVMVTPKLVPFATTAQAPDKTI